MSNCLPERSHYSFEKKVKTSKAKVAKLSATLKECSGLAFDKKTNTLWAHNDGGNKAVIYKINHKGEIVDSLTNNTWKNIDWEDLTIGSDAKVYVGDFGNNLNQRKDLKIYKLDPSHPSKLEEITFSYEDQLEFPPPKNERNFDAEALFYTNDSLYIFSKNRGNKEVKMYTLPAAAGQYRAKIKDKIWIKSQVTAADISPGGTQFVLLTYGKALFFGIDQGQINFKKPEYCIKLPLKQAEAITYISENELIIANEQGELHQLTLKPNN